MEAISDPVRLRAPVNPLDPVRTSARAASLLRGRSGDRGVVPAPAWRWTTTYAEGLLPKRVGPIPASCVENKRDRLAAAAGEALLRPPRDGSHHGPALPDEDEGSPLGHASPDLQVELHQASGPEIAARGVLPGVVPCPSAARDERDSKVARSTTRQVRFEKTPRSPELCSPGLRCSPRTIWTASLRAVPSTAPARFAKGCARAAGQGKPDVNDQAAIEGSDGSAIFDRDVLRRALLAHARGHRREDVAVKQELDRRSLPYGEVTREAKSTTRSEAIASTTMNSPGNAAPCLKLVARCFERVRAPRRSRRPRRVASPCRVSRAAAPMRSSSFGPSCDKALDRLTDGRFLHALELARGRGEASPRRRRRAACAAAIRW